MSVTMSLTGPSRTQFLAALLCRTFVHDKHHKLKQKIRDILFAFKVIIN